MPNALGFLALPIEEKGSACVPVAFVHKIMGILSLAFISFVPRIVNLSSLKQMTFVEAIYKRDRFHPYCR